MEGELYLFSPIALLLGLSILTAVIIVGFSALLGPKRNQSSKLDIYECGAPLLQENARQRYSVKYFVIAMLFILFDIEVAFMYPWAVVYRKYLSNGKFILAEMAVFVLVLLIGYAYVWRKGALEWE
ncbi:MAG: NADH-quinone oxidoreductase subunit A [Acidobacteria bacterium]|nr:MAG: NADH-quinone oxidoreductase subunit A [Acidobacteriota bacterium]